MRLSTLFGRTLREVPSDAIMTSHQLAIRAGLIRQLATGIYSYLPLGWRVLRKLEHIIRQEMDAIGGQELSMPIVQPAELWQASGRYDAPAPGPVLLRFQDRGGHDMVLGMTHEEAVTALARSELFSYRQLPVMVYQIQTKFRDEARSRGGLVRVREFIMKDGYSFHADQRDLEDYYPRVYGAYERLLQRVGVETVPVEADSGMMGGTASHEFMMVHPDGEDTLVLCPVCHYAANSEAAVFDKGPGVTTPLAPLERVATPGSTTIEGLARLLQIEARQTAKAVFYVGEGLLIFAVIRGDLEVNAHKLSAALGGAELRAATEDELRTAGIVAGYASPVGIVKDGALPIRVIVDDSLRSGANFVAGANEEGYHLLNVNYPRDFQADLVTDIALATDGAVCARCGAALRTVRSIEVGHVFKLGTKYAEAMGATFSDENGQTIPLTMGCYGLGLGRLLACIIEQHHDEWGIIWPACVAPYQVHLVSLGDRDSEVAVAAEALYERLLGQGYEVLYDDRDERAGVKFNDADLIGCPLRLTVSRRTVKENGVELKLRRSKERRLIADADIETAIEQANGGDYVTL